MVCGTLCAFIVLLPLAAPDGIDDFQSVPQILHLQVFGQQQGSIRNPIQAAAWASLQKHFPRDTFTYIISDMTANRRCIRDEFASFLDAFDSLPDDIMKSDVGRVCQLYRHGGLYIDSDYEVFAGDLFEELPKGVASIVESPYKAIEELQNSLMASPPRHALWADYLAHVFKLLKESSGEQRNAVFLTGPAVLTTVAGVPLNFTLAALSRSASPIRSSRPDVHVLPCSDFNRPTLPQIDSFQFLLKDCGDVLSPEGTRSIHWQLSEWLVRDPDVNEHLRQLCRQWHPTLDCRSAYHDPWSLAEDLQGLALTAQDGDVHSISKQHVVELRRKVLQYHGRACWQSSSRSRAASLERALQRCDDLIDQLVTTLGPDFLVDQEELRDSILA